MLTYRQQFDRLTEAYIRGEVDPYDCSACFVGNMLNRSSLWSFQRIVIDDMTGFIKLLDGSQAPTKMHFDLSVEQIWEAGYTRKDILRIESNFLRIIGEKCTLDESREQEGPNYENALFLAFESTLELLKKIHQDRREVIDETPVFTKRKTEPVCAS